MAEGNYSMDGLEERALLALEDHRGFLEEVQSLYHARLERRRANRIPTFAVLGMGRAGKDTAAKYLCGRVPGMVYAGSSSNRLCCFVAHAAGVPQEQAFAERHAHREFWKEVGHAIRGRDLTLLARLTLAYGDLAIGLRGREELHGCYQEGVIDYALWIDNPRVPADSTVEFTAGDCDLMIPNWGSYCEFYRKLDGFLRLLRSDAFPNVKVRT